MWYSVQCAVMGRSHSKTETPCQDKTYHINENNVDVIALADGAGSAKLSHYGAELVTKKICEMLSKQFDIYYGETDGAVIKRLIIENLIDELQKLAHSLDCELSDLASTLLVVAVCNDKYIIIHIGDGVIGCIKNDELKIASYPENGEFVNTTVFVTSKDALSAMKLIKGQLNGITGFALMSDGTETSLYNKREKCLAPALKRLMNLSQIMDKNCFQHELEKSFDKVIKNATTDDCSLIFLVEEDCSFRGYNKMTVEQKKQLLQLRESRCCNRRIKRYDEILEYACSPKTILQISKRIYLEKKYCKRYIDFLLQRNLLTFDNGLVYTTVIMDK